jgi:hypothetical protein
LLSNCLATASQLIDKRDLVDKVEEDEARQVYEWNQVYECT